MHVEKSELRAKVRDLYNAECITGSEYLALAQMLQPRGYDLTRSQKALLFYVLPVTVAVVIVGLILIAGIR